MDFEKIYNEGVVKYCSKTVKSKEAYKEARAYLAGGETRTVSYYHPYPITVARASGCMLYDLDGNEYIDFLNNYTSLIHGHAHPQITKSIHAAAEIGTGCPAGIEEQVKLAKILCERVPSIERIRFCNSGTEATMFAVRAARAYTLRDGIIKMEGGYHGTTDLMEYSVSPPLSGNARTKYDAIPDSIGISKNAGKDLYIAPFNNLEVVESILKENAKDIAAILVEPVLGALGVIPPQPGYLEGLRKLADDYNVLLIFDEVQTLRVALGGAQDKYNVIPDITAIAKIIGGGLPVGGFGGREDILAAFDSQQPEHLSQSGTFNGNRATMAAGATAMSLLDQEALERLEKLSERLETGMYAAIRKHNIPASVTRVGSLLNLHFTKEKPVDYATVINPHVGKLKLYHIEMMNRGIFTAPRGTWVLSTAMNEDHIDKAIGAFTEVMEMMEPLFEN